MPIEGWYAVPEAAERVGLSYWQAIRWVKEQASRPNTPPWLKRTTKGYYLHTEGLQLMAHAHNKLTRR